MPSQGCVGGVWLTGEGKERKEEKKGSKEEKGGRKGERDGWRKEKRKFLYHQYFDDDDNDDDNNDNFLSYICINTTSTT